MHGKSYVLKTHHNLRSSFIKIAQFIVQICLVAFSYKLFESFTIRFSATKFWLHFHEILTSLCLFWYSLMLSTQLSWLGHYLLSWKILPPGWKIKSHCYFYSLLLNKNVSLTKDRELWNYLESIPWIHYYSFETKYLWFSLVHRNHEIKVQRITNLLYTHVLEKPRNNISIKMQVFSVHKNWHPQKIIEFTVLCEIDYDYCFNTCETYDLLLTFSFFLFGYFLCCWMYTLNLLYSYIYYSIHCFNGVSLV